MKSGRIGLGTTLLRIGFAGVFFVFGGANPALIGYSLLNVGEAMGSPVDDPAIASEDGLDQETPILELDPERKYKSEALLSYKSTLAPYGKIVGVRSVNSTNFITVQTWKDVEEFVSGMSDEKIVVKLLEPWGSEVISIVTINRKAYPASRVRPSEDPPKTPALPEKPKTAEPKQDSKPVVLTNLNADNGSKPSLKPSEPKIAPQTSAPSSTRIDSEKTPPAQTGPKLIEPGFQSMYVKSDLKPSKTSSKPATSRPNGSRIAYLPPAAKGEPKTIEPKLPRPAIVNNDLKPAAAIATPSSGGPAVARTTSVPGSLAVGNAKLIEPGVVAISPMGADALDLMMLFASPFMPRAGSPVIDADTVSMSDRVPVSEADVRALQTRPSAKAAVDDADWLREAVDLADKMGILSCKPVITADRRQQAFALYTLYMGLQDLRTEVDRNAARLNSVLEQISVAEQPRPRDLQEVVALGRSYEKGMNSILRWNVEAMRETVKGYVAELQSMDDVRSMLTFLGGIKRQPKILADLRKVPGLEQAEE